MRFTPKSADEIASDALLPDGDYDFTITGAEDAISKAGNEMVVLDLRVFDHDGGTHGIRDYLVAGDKGIRKIRAFAVAVGMLGEYEAGEFHAPDLAGRSGRCKLKTDRQEGYEPRNAVAYYLDPSRAKAFAAPVIRRSAPQPARQAQPAMPAEIDDEIPF